MEWDDIAIEQLNMSPRVVNCLHDEGISFVGQMLLLDSESIAGIRNMGTKSQKELELVQKRIKAGEIFLSTGRFGETIINVSEESSFVDADQTVLEMAFPDCSLDSIKRIRYTDRYGMFVDDMPISDCGLSPRTANGLRRSGYSNISEIINLSEDELNKLKNFGAKCKEELFEFIVNSVKIDLSGNSFSADIDNYISRLKLSYGECNGFFDRNDFKRALNTVLQENYSQEELEHPEIVTSSNRFVEAILSHDEVKDIVKDVIRENLNSSEWVDIRSIKILMPSLVTEKDFFNPLIDELCDDDVAEIQDNQIRIRYMGIDEWVSGLKENRKQAVEYRLEGLTLEAAGNKMGITRERVRQLIEAALKDKPKLREDDYAYWFDNYDLNIEASQYIFNVSEKTYRYLTLKGNGGSKEIEEILNDEHVTKDIYIKTRDYLRLDTIKIGDSYIPKYRNLICRELAKVYCSKEEMSFEDFYAIYQNLISENGLIDDERMTFPNERAFEVRVEDSKYVLCRYRKRFRYYNIDDCDIATLIWYLHIEQYRDVEISSFKIFNDNLDLMKEYNILDGYELHSLLRKTEDIWNSDGTYKVSFGRMPFIVFGEANREKQVRNLLFQIAPVKADEFDAQYEAEYGVFARTVAANFRKYIDEYYHNGVFEINQPLLNQSEVDFMLANVSQDFYFIEDVKKLFSERFGEQNVGKINARTLKQLGYEVYSTYILKNTYTSASEYFENLLLAKDIVDINTFDSRYGYIQLFNMTLNSLRQSFELIEFDEKIFIKYERINRIYPDITKESLQRYADSIIDYIDKPYFTISSVEKSGFDLMSKHIDLKNIFDESILRISDRVRYTRCGGSLIFHKGDVGFTTIDFIRYLLEEHENIDYYDFDDILKDEYSLDLDKNKLILNYLPKFGECG